LAKSLSPIRAENVARWAMLVLCFALSMSRSLFAVAALVLIFAWALSGQWREKWQRLWHHPAGLLFTVLIIWMFTSVLWSQGEPASIWDAARVQWKLLLIPVVLTLAPSNNWIERCWLAFAAGMSLLLLHIFLLPWLPMPWLTSSSQDAVFFNPLPQSVGLAIFSAWCLFHLLNVRARSFPQAALGLLLASATYAVLQISQQRLGYIAWLIGVTSVLALHASARQRVLGFGLLLLFCATTLAITPKIQARVLLMGQEIQNYEFKNNYTSVGARLHMWYVGIDQVRKRPLTGHGLGSYRTVATTAFNDETMCQIGCAHPHNQYLYYALEFGLIGLALFISFIFVAWRSLAKQRLDATLPRMIILIFSICGLADTTLWYRGFTNLFIPLIGIIVLYSSTVPNIKKISCA
jgi:O-antigen ligase